MVLKFSGNRLAVCTCSISMNLVSDAVIVGTKGTIKVRGSLLYEETFKIKATTKKITSFSFTPSGNSHYKEPGFVRTSCILVISTPAAPPHVVPHRVGGKWEDDALSPARDRPASELRPQCGFTIWRWRGQALPPQRYKLQNAHICITIFTQI